ncbi:MULTISPECIES: MarR family winged helix-turn-helix transcriptional regulator [Paraburkholderia]|uniref:MarR family winged helix-turn-helix transcriptional regulator n=1 Tax=Paraburkholderia TaxID=1822464 RepID=UPI000B63F43A|nr:hypothetical protein BWU74_30950 [Burkholderia sp. Bk]
MKTQLLSDNCRKAIGFLERLSEPGESTGSMLKRTFPPEVYRYDTSQIEILSTLISDVYEQTIQPQLGMSVKHARILESIGYADKVTAAELAQYWEFDKMTVSRAVQSLRKRGLIETCPHPSDKRRIALRLTSAGHVAFRHEEAVKARFLNALSEAITTEEMRVFTDTARRLIDHFRRVKEMLG